MELKDMKLEEFRAGRPDLAATLIKEGHDKGFGEGKAAAENDSKTKSDFEKARVAAISQKAKEIQGDDAVAFECIANGDSPEAAETKMKEAKLKAIQTGAPGAMGGGNAGEDRTGVKDHLTLAREYQAAHKCSMEDALIATAPKREQK